MGLSDVMSQFLLRVVTKLVSKLQFYLSCHSYKEVSDVMSRLYFVYIGVKSFISSILIQEIHGFCSKDVLWNPLRPMTC